MLCYILLVRAPACPLSTVHGVPIFAQPHCVLCAFLAHLAFSKGIPPIGSYEPTGHGRKRVRLLKTISRKTEDPSSTPHSCRRRLHSRYAKILSSSGRHFPESAPALTGEETLPRWDVTLFARSLVTFSMGIPGIPVSRQGSRTLKVLEPCDVSFTDHVLV